MRIRRWVRVALLVVTTMVVATAGVTAQAPRVKIKEAHTGTLFMAPVFIAEAAGFMGEEGIDLELIEVD
ncbi:MAG: hypothetical protein HYU65_05685, partial [Armatimonadetes bacterium]|nr:hypothetical protein [Armatimonadota bacterium]